jgi:U1 small nuclear ribonucleoprotein
MSLFDTSPAPPVEPFEEPKKKKLRLKEEKAAQHKEALAKMAESYKPSEDPKIVGDAYKTLFVGRLSYDTTEKKLQREFGAHGTVKSIHLIQDKEGNSRGYAFVEFEKEEDMRIAYKQMDGKKIDGHKILVDVERGRTVRNWVPRKYGGGLGDTRKTRLPMKEEKDKAKEEALKAQQAGASRFGSGFGGGPPRGGGYAGGDRRGAAGGGGGYRDSSRDSFGGHDRDRDRGGYGGDRRDSRGSYGGGRDYDRGGYDSRDRDRGGRHEDRDRNGGRDDDRGRYDRRRY